MYEMQNRLYTELYEAIYASKLRTKMHQHTCVDFKLGYVDAKSDVIALCVKIYPSGSFIKNRTRSVYTKCDFSPICCRTKFHNIFDVSS